ncbi:MAG: hypothetical protein ACLTW9_14975 [Enterocloster sp.]
MFTLLNSMVNCTQGINSTPDFKNILLLGVLGIQLSYPKLYQFVLINAKYLSMTVEGKQVCLLEYITNPEYQDELANTDADIYLYKAPKNIPELYSLKEQLEEAGISDEWDELWGVLETYTKLLKDSKNSIPTGNIRDIYKYIEFIRAFFLWLTKKGRFQEKHSLGL